MPSFRALDSALATYSYALAGAGIGAAVTDGWQLQGVNLKTVKIRWIMVGGTAAAARSQIVQLMRRPTPSTGGAFTNPPGRSADSSDGSVSSAIVTQWTTPPTTLGSPSLILDMQSFAMVVAGSLQDRAIFNYEQLTLKPLTLNSSSEFLAVNFSFVTTIVTDKIDFEMWWTEQ